MQRVRHHEAAPGAFPGMEATITDQKFGGWMRFDVNKGYSDKAEVHIAMAMDIKAQGQTGSMTMKAKVIVTQTLE